MLAHVLWAAPPYHAPGCVQTETWSCWKVPGAYITVWQFRSTMAGTAVPTLAVLDDDMWLISSFAMLLVWFHSDAIQMCMQLTYVVVWGLTGFLQMCSALQGV